MIQACKVSTQSNKTVVEKLNENFDDIQQVTMRLVKPELTNTPEWFLKHDLVTHPRFAHSRKSISRAYHTVLRVKN